MSRPKVLITNYNLPQAGLDLLKRNCDLVINEERPSPTREQIKAKVPGVDAIYWIGHERLDAEILNLAGPQLKGICNFGAGVDSLDVAEIKRRGIPVGNTPKVVDDGVAEIAVILALAAARRVQEARNQIENGTWTPGVQWLLGQDIRGSTVGIVGLGGIGQATVKRLKPFEVKEFIYTGHAEKPEGVALGARFVSFDELLQKSDFVIVCCPLNEETKNLFNDAAFDKMKSNAVFVNIARGGIVDQDALIRALEGGKIFAAGLDVMTPEPLPKDHKLVKLPNCVLIPHLGTATLKSRSDMATLGAQNILQALGGAPMFTPI